MERSAADTKEKKSCPVTLSSPVTSVTHNSPSPYLQHTPLCDLTCAANLIYVYIYIYIYIRGLQVYGESVTGTREMSP